MARDEFEDVEATLLDELNEDGFAIHESDDNKDFKSKESTLLQRIPSQLIVFLCLQIVIYISMGIPSLAGMDLIYKIVCIQENIPDAECMASTRSSELVSTYISVNSLVQGVLAITVTPYLSSLSDKVGRKKIFIYCVSVNTIGLIFEWYLAYGMSTPANYWWLLASNFVSSLSGGMLLLSAMGVSVVSDLITDAKDRARIFSIVDASMPISSAISPALCSLVLMHTSISALYWMCIILLTVNVILVQVFVQETLSAQIQERNESNSWREGLKLISFRHVKDPIARRNVLLVLGCALLGVEFLMASSNVLFVYMKSAFGWTAVEIGGLISGASIIRTAMFLVVFPLAYSWFSKTWRVYPDQTDRIDVIFIRMLTFFMSTGFFLFVFCKTPITFIFACVLESLSAIGMPALKSTLFKSVPHGQAGTFMAGFGFLNSLVITFLPSIMLQFYHWSLSFFPTLPFLVTGLIMTGLFASTFLIKTPRE